MRLFHLPVLGLCLLLGCSCGQSDLAMAVSRDSAAPRLTFRIDGEPYHLRDGNVYDASNRLIQKVYDPDFFEKYYRIENDKIYLVDPESKKRFETITTHKEDFESADSVEEFIDREIWQRSNADPRKKGERGNYYNLGNRLSISTDRAHSGNQALLIRAVPDKRDVSKASLTRKGVCYRKGDTVEFSMWLYLEPTEEFSKGFTIFDLESDWLHNSPGMRLIFRGPYLAFELKSFEKINYTQDSDRAEVFPVDRWVHLKGSLTLSDGKDGKAKLWQDGKLVIDAQGITLPLFDTVYNSVEIGISAIGKGAKDGKVLYVDDFEITSKKAG